MRKVFELSGKHEILSLFYLESLLKEILGDFFLFTHSLRYFHYFCLLRFKNRCHAP